MYTLRTPVYSPRQKRRNPGKRRNSVGSNAIYRIYREVPDFLNSWVHASFVFSYNAYRLAELITGAYTRGIWALSLNVIPPLHTHTYHPVVINYLTYNFNIPLRAARIFIRLHGIYNNKYYETNCIGFEEIMVIFVFLLKVISTFSVKTIVKKNNTIDMVAISI